MSPENHLAKEQQIESAAGLIGQSEITRVGLLGHEVRTIADQLGLNNPHLHAPESEHRWPNGSTLCRTTEQPNGPGQSHFRQGCSGEFAQTTCCRTQ